MGNGNDDWFYFCIKQEILHLQSCVQSVHFRNFLYCLKTQMPISTSKLTCVQIASHISCVNVDIWTCELADIYRFLLDHYSFMVFLPHCLLHCQLIGPGVRLIEMLICEWVVYLISNTALYRHLLLLLLWNDKNDWNSFIKGNIKIPISRLNGPIMGSLSQRSQVMIPECSTGYALLPSINTSLCHTQHITLSHPLNRFRPTMKWMPVALM